MSDVKHWMLELRHRAPRPFRTVLGILYELAGAVRLAGDLRSFGRLSCDVLLFRLIGRLNIPGANRERRIRLRDGIDITYRLNRGDIQSIREVWMEQAYRLPFTLRPKIIIDLGANIGLTSVWLAHRYKPTRIIAVEPSPDNARLARLNLSRNNVPSELIEAAVGPQDGTALFQGSGDSNIGRVGTAGAPVPVVSMRTILSRHSPGSAVDLMKMDIEGGEQALLTENTEWLDQIRSIVAEFHPDVVDYGGLIKRLESEGFRYLPAGRGAMDCFVRAAS